MGPILRTGPSAILIAALVVGCTQSDDAHYREFSENDIPVEKEDASEVVVNNDANSQSASSPQTTVTQTDTVVSGIEGNGVEPSTESDLVAKTANTLQLASNGEGNQRDASAVAQESDPNAAAEDSETTPANSGGQSDLPITKARRTPKILVEAHEFHVEGPQQAIRVSYDDIDLLRVLNMEPVTMDAPQMMPGWLKDLDGRRIRIRGFMYPPELESGNRAFRLARDNQICCFQRFPRVYDVFDVFLRKGETTDYIVNRPFDVVGTFYIRPDVLSNGEVYQLYEMEDAVVIDPHRR